MAEQPASSMDTSTQHMTQKPPPVPLRESPSAEMRKASQTSTNSQQGPKPVRKIQHPQLCQFGQELVQELTYKALEIFQIFRAPMASLPTGQVSSRKNFDERIRRLREQSDQISGPNGIMSKLEKIFDAIDQDYSVIDNYQLIEKLLADKPQPETYDSFSVNTDNTEKLEALTKQRDELKSNLKEKNDVLKEVIHEYRELIVELNAMSWS